jgi:GDP-L-fucose synthase
VIAWANKRVAVLGGGGFLGRRTCAALRARGVVELAVPRTAEGWDFRDPRSADAFFAQAKPELVFNCAARQGGLAYQREHPADIYRDNLLMGLHSMDAARVHGVERYVNVVAACSYPGYVGHERGLLSEDDYWSGPVHDSVLSYAGARRAHVVQALLYAKQYGFNALSLLMTNLYGPGESYSPDRSHGLAALLVKIYRAKREGGPVEIWGSGAPIREWLYVDDAAEALVLAAERYRDPQPVNIALGGGLSITALAHTIAKLVGYTGEFVYAADKPDGAPVKTFTADRFHAATGWTPQTSLEEGLRRSIRWLDAHPDLLSGSASNV